MADHESLALQLTEFVPQATLEQARQYLEANNWELDAAAASLMADLEEADVGATAPEPTSTTQPAAPEYTGPRTLDGRPAPQAATASSSRSSKPQQKKKGLATLSSLGGGDQTHDHDDDDDDDDEDDDERGPRDTYAGGEKSGLALQDPNKRSATDQKKIIKDLLKQAKS
jgi:UBX domain-containing protein 1